jgi:hypothetical protein
MGCSRVRESSCRVAGIVFRTKRTTANEPATIGPRFTPPRLADQTHTTTTPAPRPIRRWRPGGSAPQPPRDLPLLCRARREKQKRDAPCIPSPISAPESALGSRLRVALSSAQVTEHFICAAFAELQPVRAQGPKTPPGPGRSSLSQSASARFSQAQSAFSGTCQESNRPVCVRPTRSWAVVFSITPHFSAQTLRWPKSPAGTDPRHGSYHDQPKTNNFFQEPLDTTASFREGHWSRRLVLNNVGKAVEAASHSERATCQRKRISQNLNSTRTRGIKCPGR